MFFSVLFCTVRLSIFERFVFASFEPLRFCKKVRFVFPDLELCFGFYLRRFFIVSVMSEKMPEWFCVVHGKSKISICKKMPEHITFGLDI